MTWPVSYSSGVDAIEKTEELVGRPDGENVLIHQSWLNQLPLLLLLLLLEALIIYVRIEFSDRSATKLPETSVDTLISMLPIVPLLILIKAAYPIINERLVVTPQYIIHVMGRISWRERSVRLEYGHIQEIEIEQTILQRMLGLGDISIVALGGANVAAIHMHGLANPRGVKDLIRARRSEVEGVQV